MSRRLVLLADFELPGLECRENGVETLLELDGLVSPRLGRLLVLDGLPLPERRVFAEMPVLAGDGEGRTSTRLLAGLGFLPLRGFGPAEGLVVGALARSALRLRIFLHGRGKIGRRG